MSKSFYVHYRNKYPTGMVFVRDSDLDVFLPGGAHAVAIRGGMDVSEQLGCRDRHDLSPLPKNARFLKLGKDGLVKKDEKHDERRPVAESLAKDSVGGEGKVPSIEELAAAGAELKAPTGEPHNAEFVSKGKTKG